MKSLSLIVLGIGVVAIPMSSQAPAGAKPQFEVASIKSSGPVVSRITIAIQPGGRLVVEGFTLRMLVSRAYGVTDSRIFSGPNWAGSERFNIEAKAVRPNVDAAGFLNRDQLPLMLQSLLEDRFRLKVHREMRELPSYELLVARSGPKIKLSADQSPPGPLPPPLLGNADQRGASGNTGSRLRSSSGRGNGTTYGSAVTLVVLVNNLSQILGRPVIDKTGLDGLFDYELHWTPGMEQAAGPFGPNDLPPPPPSDASSPSIFTALQEQLGLRLESTKSSVETVVIDSAQRPSEN